MCWHIPAQFCLGILIKVPFMDLLQIKISTYRAATFPLTWYRNKYVPLYEHVGLPPKEWIRDYEEASNLIFSFLESDKPCCVGRYGSNEFLCMENFMKRSHPLWRLRNLFPFWAPSSLLHSMRQNAGFFSPDGYQAFSRFADLYYESAKEVDVLACWFKNQEVVEKEMNYKICWILSIEPWWAKNPWTRYLKGKKVLVVHPFAETIESQYKKRGLLFDNPDVLPEFSSLTIIKAVQSIGGENNGFRDWFEALHYMEEQVDKVDYEVALIGCGAYGLPLAAHCKKRGKKAVHLGGALQLLFGIKGNRWESPSYGRELPGIDYQRLLSNPNWVRPLETEKAKNSEKVEGACYW